MILQEVDLELAQRRWPPLQELRAASVLAREESKEARYRFGRAPAHVDPDFGGAIGAKLDEGKCRMFVSAC